MTRYHRHHVGFVFQFYNLIPSLTAPEQFSGEPCNGGRISATNGGKPTKSEALTAWTFGAKTLPDVWSDLVEAVSALVAKVG